MECYQCLQAGITRDAAGLCHHCSAALCPEHICVLEDVLKLKHIMAPSEVLPKRARILLCSTCKAALEQPYSEQALFENVMR
jgi:hypothetical protein